MFFTFREMEVSSLKLKKLFNFRSNLHGLKLKHFLYYFSLSTKNNFQIKILSYFYNNVSYNYNNVSFYNIFFYTQPVYFIFFIFQEIFVTFTTILSLFFFLFFRKILITFMSFFVAFLCFFGNI